MRPGRTPVDGCRREDTISRRGATYSCFQAEDGIRDIGVTGVQTCALPILSGQEWSGTETGTLGESYRVKVPVFGGGDEEGADIIGSVSVGVLESELAADVQARLPWLLLALGGAAVVGVFGAAWVAAVIRRRILGLEPEQIAELVGERETMLHRLSEGVVRVDRDGVIVSANDAAVRLLGGRDVVGARAADVLDAPIVEVLERGEREGRLVLAGERPLIARADRKSTRLNSSHAN